MRSAAVAAGWWLGLAALGGLGAAASAYLPADLVADAPFPLALSLVASLAAAGAAASGSRARTRCEKMSGELDAISARLLRQEAAGRPAPEGDRDGLGEVAAEIGTVSRLVGMLAETVAQQEREIRRLADRLGGEVERRPAFPPMPEQAPHAPAAETVVPSFLPARPAATPAAARRGPDGEADILEAVAAGRIDLHVQPVMQLPQRRTRFHEVFAILRPSEASVLVPDEYMPVLGRRDRLPSFDRAVLTAALEKVASAGIALPVSCAVSARSLSDPDFLDGLDRLTASFLPDEARLILKIDQDGLGPLARAGSTVARLAGRGVALSVELGPDGAIDPGALARSGARYAKIAASRLLDGAGRDLSGLPGELARSGIELVAEDVEGEEVIPELLEIGVRLAQGFAFAIPAPMDALATRGERRPDPPAAPPSERETLLGLRDYLRRAR